jgi:hypothetical protein
MRSYVRNHVNRLISKEGALPLNPHLKGRTGFHACHGLRDPRPRTCLSYGIPVDESPVIQLAFVNWKGSASRICVLEDLALEEIDAGKLEVIDASYPVAVTVRARKPEET